MSEVLPHKKVLKRKGTVSQYRTQPVKLDFLDGTSPAEIELSNGTEGFGTCLGCHDAPCMIMGAHDFTLPEVLSAFPGDPARHVCPTHAISWNEPGTSIMIDAELCIGCCLCIARCPYGAISSTVDGTVLVESADPSKLTELSDDLEERNGHPHPNRVGLLCPVGSPAFEKVPESVGSLSDTSATQFVRNLLIECGVMCRTRRKGDTNMRIDGIVGLTSGIIGVLEIELNNSVLDSPRALLEDIAVIHGRYALAVSSIEAISVILGLPNTRSEYYQVIADIEKVLGINCRTVTIGALLIVLQYNLKVVALAKNLFMTNPSDTNLLIGMKEHLLGTISSTEPYPGAFRPSK